MAEVNLPQDSDFLFFTDLAAFSRAVEKDTGVALDFAQVLELTTDFVEANNQYMVINIKEYDGDVPDNLLFLNETKAYGFSKKQPKLESIEAFDEVLKKPFGKSTVLSFLVLDKVMTEHKVRLESMTRMIRKIEDDFNHSQYRVLAREIDRLGDRLDEFHELLIKLQERKHRQIETKYISFDYSVLLAESLSLQGRCRRRSNTLKDLSHDHDVMATEELNQRVVRLNDVVKKLTALTVILMLPTLIANHFGMNFAHMPELQEAWAYPATIAFQVIFMIAGFVVFKKIGWL